MAIEENAASRASVDRVVHTPGPWEVMDAVDSHGNRGVYVFGGKDICDLYTYRKDEHGIERELVPFENAVANARLIAAAPELLEALVESLSLNINWSETAEDEHLRHLSEYKGVIGQAKAAIEQATGEKVM